jgi:hypothetical protein
MHRASCSGTLGQNMYARTGEALINESKYPFILEIAVDADELDWTSPKQIHTSDNQGQI